MSEKFKEGQTVKGTIYNVTSNAIYLDVADEENLEKGVKAVIYSNDLKDVPKNVKLFEEYQEGADFEAQIKKIDKDQKDGSTLLILSTKLADIEAEKQRKIDALNAKIDAIKEIKEKDEIINAKVNKVTKNGVELIYNNTRVFLPYKNASLSEEAFNKMKGEEIPVIITFVNDEHHQVFVSQIAAEKKTKRLAKEAAYASYQVGQEVEGTVVSILPYGAIVSLGEVSGLLHITELDHFQVKDINKVLTVGQKIKTKIIKLNEGKIGLSVKALTKHPWDILKEQYHVGDVFKGTVKKIIPAGLIIALTDKYSGLMPKVEYSWLINERYENTIKEGDQLDLKVMNIDDEKHRVSLSHRETLENTWGGIKLRRGEVIEVKIISSNDRGAQVSYLNVMGYLPITEVTSSKRVSNVTDVFPLDSTVKVMVLDFDASRAKLVVSAKALEIKKERDTFESYMKEQAKEDTKSTLGDVFKSLESKEN